MVEIKPQNITFLISSMEGGGAQKAILLLINELCKRGWHISLLICNEGFFLKKLDENVEIILLKRRKISSNLFEIANYLKRNSPTFFHSSMTYVNVIAGLAVILSNFKGKVLFSEHSNLSARNANNKNLLNSIITFLAKIVYKKANAVVCVSKGVKADINNVISHLKSSVVIYNPVENFYTERKYNNGIFRVLSMGRMDKEKNFSLLIQAFSIVVNKYPKDNNDLELYILGDGPERKRLKMLVDELELTDKVFLPGFTDPCKPLSSSNLFVLPSNREGFGNVLVEAMSCGLPVISTDCPSGPSEILMNGKLGKLVPVNDIQSMAEAIIEAINDPDRYSTRGERIRRAKDFSVEKIVNEYESLLERL